jgi:RNA polymerase sigma-70 factor (TIGR02960 family)
MVDATLAAALGGDEAAFGRLAARHRRELHVHCYRMLASFDDAEDAVQETLLRAWNRRGTFEGGDGFRAWLYRIATNVCLDLIRRRKRRPVVGDWFSDVPWLQPYPDPLLDEAIEDAVVRRETIELMFLAALQTLPPRQRAALIARDVLGWPAAETAAHLGTSVAAANSALQRARAALQSRLPTARSEWTRPSLSREEQEVLDRFVDAHQRGDAAAALALAATDIRVTMPPAPMRFEGREALRPLLMRAFGPDRDGDWRLLPTSVNTMPAAASYLRRPGDSAFRPFKLDVLHVRGGRIAEITTFGYLMFPDLGLPPTL